MQHQMIACKCKFVLGPHLSRLRAVQGNPNFKANLAAFQFSFIVKAKAVNGLGLQWRKDLCKKRKLSLFGKQRVGKEKWLIMPCGFSRCKWAVDLCIILVSLLYWQIPSYYESSSSTFAHNHTLRTSIYLHAYSDVCRYVYYTPGCCNKKLFVK